MSKMRLTTLNLDEACHKVLGEHKNKSKYAREAILRYDDLVKEFDDLENDYTEERYGLRDLCRFLTEYAHRFDLVGVLAEYMDKPEIEIERMLDMPYPEAFLKEVAIRRGKL